jgi:hypothetical protein
MPDQDETKNKGNMDLSLYGEMLKQFYDNVARIIRSKHGAPFYWKDRWRKANPADLLAGMVANIHEGAAGADPKAWEKVAAYAMFMANLSTEQKARLTQGPKLLTIQVSADLIESLQNPPAVTLKGKELEDAQLRFRTALGNAATKVEKAAKEMRRKE